MAPVDGRRHERPVEGVDDIGSRLDESGVQLVRFVFVDQHGLLRGKTIARPAADAAFGAGVTAPSSLLLKDTSGRSVFNPFAADPGVGVAGLGGAADVVLWPDPASFRPLPWSPRTGLVLCDLRFPGGEPVPFCTRSLLREVAGRVAHRGYGLTIGPELELHLYRDDSPQLAAEEVGQPGAPGAAPLVSPTTAGAQLLHSETLDRFDEVVEALHEGLTGLGLPLRTIELEFGPSQFELTLDAAEATVAADDVVLARSAVRQICARLGYRATFMSRPAGADTASSGWHLHQSLTELASGRAAFTPSTGGEILSEVGRQYLAGLLANADAATAFSTPTVNGYKRYRPYSLAPDRRVWGVDNRGAMLRAIGRQGDPGSRVENRSGEPGANPYLYIASQAIAGLDGIDRALDPGPPTAEPYDADAPRLPRTLGDALDALDASDVFRSALGGTVVDWYLALKRAELDRYLAHVSDWEQREYLRIL
jgi:glutamine synthetase